VSIFITFCELELSFVTVISRGKPEPDVIKARFILCKVKERVLPEMEKG
jgi:hypothetical protein